MYIRMYVRIYVCTCMSTPDICMFIHTHTNAAQMLAASVLGTTVKFYKRRHVGLTCLKIPGENSDTVTILDYTDSHSVIQQPPIIRDFFQVPLSVGLERFHCTYCKNTSHIYPSLAREQ